MSLRDRLGGRKSNGATPPPARETPAGSRPSPVSSAIVAPRTSSLYSPLRTEEPVLSQVDQLKVDLHRRLIERLDLDALEQIKNEQELATQIRHAVLEFLRADATPLSQREREDIVEQIVYEVT